MWSFLMVFKVTTTNIAHTIWNLMEHLISNKMIKQYKLFKLIVYCAEWLLAVDPHPQPGCYPTWSLVMNFNVDSLTWHWLFVCGTWLLFRYIKWFITTGHVIGFLFLGSVEYLMHSSYFQRSDIVFSDNWFQLQKWPPALMEETSPNKVIQSSYRLNSEILRREGRDTHRERWWLSPSHRGFHCRASVVIIFLPEGAEYESPQVSFCYPFHIPAAPRTHIAGMFTAVLQCRSHACFIKLRASVYVCPCACINIFQWLSLSHFKDVVCHMWALCSHPIKASPHSLYCWR